MDKKTTEEHLKSPLVPWWFWALAAGIVLLWALGPQVVRLWMGWMEAGGGDAAAAAAGAGTFGDQFGAINTLFSGLAFLGVLVSLWIQGREFRHQLEEMRVNAQEMQTQSKIYDEQLKMLRRQNDLLGHQLINAQVQERLAAQPFLVIMPGKVDFQFDVKVQNDGATVYGVEITSPESFEDNDKITIATLANGRVCERRLLLDMDKVKTAVHLHVQYVTRLGMSGRESFVVARRFFTGSGERQIMQTDMVATGQRIREAVEKFHAPT